MGAVHRGDVDILAGVLIIEENSADAFIWTEPVMWALLLIKEIGCNEQDPRRFDNLAVLALAIYTKPSIFLATLLLARMFATDVWLLVAASVIALLMNKVIVYTQFSIGILAQAIIGTLGKISQGDIGTTNTSFQCHKHDTARCTCFRYSLALV